MMSDGADGGNPRPLHVQNFLTYRIARAHAKLSAQITSILARGPGISLVQWRVLAILGDEGAMTRAELSRLLDLDKSQISHCLKVMINALLVAAVEDGADSRPRYLSLTDKGRAIYRQTAPVVLERQRRMMATLDPDETRALFSALRKLEDFAGIRDF